MMYRKLPCILLLVVISLCVMPKRCFAKTETFVLWQLPSQTGGQMNSYVMQTVNGKVIVIDGGYEGDAPYLKGFLAAIGNHVDMWFVSHQHTDHIDALTAILKNPGDLKIDKIYGSILDTQWIKAYEAEECLKTTVDFNEALKAAQKELTELTLGQVIKIDKITIEVLGIKNPEILVDDNILNNSSVVMRVWDTHKSILFTGDLGAEGGQKLMKGPYRNRLKSDYVQMAHHGQNGVDEDFYKAVSPKYCIWPTPLWLWDNNSGKGKGSGTWKTLEVRCWMDKLNVQKHYRLFDGLITIR
jgi:beta-lactamase superfamily II metal-dependent hydrolase